MTIRLERVSKAFAGTLVLSDLSMEFPDQGVLCITGPSGCGKTTLLKTIAGLIEPDSGHIRGLDGRRLSMAFADDVLLPWLTAEENVALVVKDDPARVQGALALVEMQACGPLFPGELSKGMSRRIALARALAYDGDALLLDEPTNSLDARLAHTVMRRIVEGRQGRLTICVSHDETLLGEFATQLFRAEGLPLRLFPASASHPL